MNNKNPESSISLLLILFSSVVCESPSQEDTMGIHLQPVPGKMMVNATSPHLGNQVFGLGIPETIGCRERMWLVFTRPR